MDCTTIISLVFSCIGSLTGVSSLCVVAYNNAFQRGKQTFKISEQRGTYYFPASDTKVKGCWKPTYCAVVSIKAINNSSYPITISNAEIRKEGSSARHYNEFAFDNIYIKESQDGETWKDTEPNAKLPLKLEPFETKYFSFSFPFFKSFVSQYGEDIDVELIITTARKEHKIKVVIPEYYGLFTNRDSNSSFESVATGRSNNKHVPSDD